MPEQRGVFDCQGLPVPLAVTLLSNTLVQNQIVGTLVVDVSALLANVFGFALQAPTRGSFMWWNLLGHKQV